MKWIITASLLFSPIGFVQADESTQERVEAKGKDANRQAKKRAHRAEERLCDKDDPDCMAEKAGNRLEEGRDYAKDKTKEAANKVDE